MKLSELEGAVTKAQADEAAQNTYVLALGKKLENGETTIEVFSDGVWTTVTLADFWKLQYDKYIAMAEYAGKLVTRLQTLQKQLDDALAGIAVPVNTQTIAK